MAQTQHTVGIQITAQDKASAVFKSHAATLAQAQAGYESLSDFMKREAAEAQKVATANNQAAESVKNAGNAAEGANSGFSTLFKTFTLASLASTAIQAGIQLATQSIKDAVTEATNFERSLAGLNSTAQAFGQSTNDVNAAVTNLTSDGLVGFTTTATALKNLLSTGMDVDKATSLIQRFKDEAAFGRAETIKYGDAVLNLSEAYLTSSSQAGNLNGHVANFSDALEIGADALGKTTAQLTKAETEQAKFIGYMQQGAGAVGNASDYADTYAGSVSRMESEQQKAAATMGQNLLPALEYLTSSYTDLIASSNGSAQATQEFQSYLVTLAAVVRTVAQAVVGAAGVIYGALKSVFTLSWDPLVESVDNAAAGFIDTWDDAYKQYEKIYNAGNEGQSDAFGSALGSMVDANSAAQRKLQQQVDDANQQFARSMEQRAKQFSESLRDMVIAHRDKSRTIQADLAKEDAAYQKSALNREKDFKEDLSSLEEGHLEKVTDIEEKIADERASGYAVDGVLYAEANEEKIRKLEEQLVKEQATYQKSVDKRKAQYDEDVAEDKARHDEKILQLQTALEQERVILEQHRADVAAVGEAQKEDDLSRLKRQFAEANAEAERNHQEQLVRIRRQAGEQGAVYGSGVVNGASAALGKLSEENRKALDASKQQFANGGNQSAQSMWEGFKNGLSQWFGQLPSHFATLLKDIDKSTGAITGAATLLKMLPGGGVTSDSLLRLLNLPKRAEGGPVQAGKPYIVGEREPEVFVPNQNGQILNQSQMQSAMGASGRSVAVNIGTVINQSTMDVDSFFSSLSWQLR
jgi:hypothetical protein